MLIFHILVALAGIVATGIAYARPSSSKIYVATLLAAITLATGVYLTVTHPAHMTESCILGLIYFGFVGFGIVAARRRLQIV